MTSAPISDTPTSTIADRAIRTALARAVDSPQLANSARLQAFLRYVVDQSLQGRGQQIVGKIIAQDVYGRTPEDGSDNIVRVDARRLRRALAEYYGADGQSDPVRIHIDKGQYAPRFERVQEDPPSAPVPTARPARRRQIAITATLAVTLCCIGLWAALRTPPSPAPQDNSEQERMALAEKSMATLQAANLSLKASELLFPLADVDHQRTATDLFRNAIRIDPGYADSYAGAAHSLSTLALLSPDAETRQTLLNDATQMAHRAVDLDPTSGWSISSTAWLAFASRDYTRALELSERAASLSQQDGRVLDYHALILILTGDFAQAQRVSDPDIPRKTMGLHQAHRNIHGVASFHLGDYDTAIKSFDAAIALGGPVSELTLVFKASSEQARGNTKAAKRLLQSLTDTWPDFRPDLALRGLYADPAHANQVLNVLEEIGRN
jgi:tetratricopeptide (TPR) repeat protein